VSEQRGAWRVVPPRARWLAVVGALATLVAPAAAGAHIRSGVVAVDYRASVSPLDARARSAVMARIYESDRAVGLTVRSGHTVVVLGYLGEPLLRIDSQGVAVNAASPTAAAVGLLKDARRVSGTGLVWGPRSSGRTVVWHDGRLRGLAPEVKQRRWGVPLVVDGERVRLEGEIWRVPAPSLWPWLALGAACAAVTLLLLLVRRPALIRLGAVAFGALTAAATVVTATGFALDPNASGVSWFEGGNEVVLAAVGLAALARGSKDARAVAGGALGLLGLFVGALKFGVLTHGVVLSELPDTVARIAVVLTLSAGAAATVLGALSFARVLAAPDERLLTLSSTRREPS
jgi:hypothetical protein